MSVTWKTIRVFISSTFRDMQAEWAWLVEAIEQWRRATDRTSRLFWFIGAPGVGKSAFASHLVHYCRNKVIVFQFCEYDKPDQRNAHRIVRPLDFQIATWLHNYRKLLLTLLELTERDRKNPAELFDHFRGGPLCHTIDCRCERYLIALSVQAQFCYNLLKRLLAKVR
jgi:hypothetical protein